MAPWADEPFTLIPTPSSRSLIHTHQTAIWIADEMCNAHNGLLRSLNSMYLQAPFVRREEDVKDLLTYATFWEEWIHHHHDAEEELFFPDIERITGVKGIMERNVVQHHEFLPALLVFGQYAKDCTPATYSAVEFRRLIDAFSGPMSIHLSDEIETLLALSKYNMEELKEAYISFDKKLQGSDSSTSLPLVLGSSDSEYEGGNNWPIVPSLLKYLVQYYFERKHQSVWRFNPSTTWGVRRPLIFLQQSK